MSSPSEGGGGVKHERNKGPKKTRPMYKGQKKITCLGSSSYHGLQYDKCHMFFAA